MKKEFLIFDEFIKLKGLRHTSQREKILNIFLSTERHVSCQDLYGLVKRRSPGISYTTVYRTLRLLSESGLCQEFEFGDGLKRFEHKYGHQHHDHLICIKCGRFFEVMDSDIERLQKRLTKKHKFSPVKHKMQIFGYCIKCKR